MTACQCRQEDQQQRPPNLHRAHRTANRKPPRVPRSGAPACPASAPGSSADVSTTALPPTGSAAPVPAASGSSAPVVSTAPPDPSASPSDPRPHTRAKSDIRKPKTYTYGTVRYGLLAEPNNLSEALSDSNWKLAMDNEYLALLKNKT